MISRSHAYVLHARAYQNTSQIVQLFTSDFGCVDVVAKGSKRVTRGKQRFALNPFQELSVEYSGRGHLFSLKASECTSYLPTLQGHALYCGLYMNEILTYLLPKSETVKDIYHLYQKAVDHIRCSQSPMDFEPILRYFEFHLLTCLGYGIDFTEVGSGNSLDNELYYHYQTGEGFKPIEIGGMKGQHLNDLNRYFFYATDDAIGLDADLKRVAKQLLRPIISDVIGGKPLKSRELFIK